MGVSQLKGAKKLGKGKTGAFRHSDLNRRFHSLGLKARRSLPKGYKPLRDPAGHKSDIFVYVIARKGQGSGYAKYFNGAYRRSLPSHDEILSTASVREIVSGVLAAHGQQPLGKTEIDAVNSAINDVSRVRMRTAHVGYAFSATDVMQHPTSVGEAVFANPLQTSSSHAYHDIRRRQAAVEEAEAEIHKPDANIVSVTRAALRGAVLYTLNEMTAAASASDVKPFARASTRGRRMAQVADRERLKDALLAVGGQVEPDDPNEKTLDQRLSRRSRTTQGTRSASPFRR